MAIVKILSRHSPSYGSLVRYVLRYIANEDKAKDSLIYTQNLRSDNVNGYVKEFMENEAFRPRSRADQIHLFHEIVSFGAGENRQDITSAMIDDLAHAYMRLRGETGVMLGGAHYDRDHVHLHFCVSALQYRTGKSFGLSKQQLQQLKVSFQEYHRTKYPELMQSFPEHGKGGRHMHPAQWHVLKREEIAEQVRSCFEQATSQQDFLNRLRDVGLHHYERNGVPTGITHEGVKFRFSRILKDRELSSLLIDRSEEEQVLAEIKSIRARQHERDDRSRDEEEMER